MPVFERAEYQDRIRKVRTRMERQGLDALVVSDPANLNYLVGYDGWSFYTHQCLVLGLDGDDPLWIGRAQDAAGAHLTTILSPDRIIGYPDDYVHSKLKHPMEFVAEVMRTRGLDRGAIGVELDCFSFTGACYARLGASLPNGRLTDSLELVNWVRAVKSPAEIALMRQAGKIVERAMTVAIEAIAPGVRLCDVVGEISRAQIRGTEEFGGDYPAIVPLLPTGAASGAPHLTWTDAPLEPQQGTIIEIAGVRHRYHCPMSRTVYLGTPPQEVLDTAAVVVEGVEAALAAVKPGALVEEVVAAWAGVIARYGIRKDSRIGYSTGLNYPPDWGERTMSLRPGDKTVLEPNMAFHLIPGLWTKDWGLHISQCFRVTESGHEALTAFPRQLFVKT